MKLHEYQSKTIFSKYGIPIPNGRVAATAEEAKHIAEELGGRVVIKSQVLVGGRGKAGGVKVAKDPKEAAEYAGQILAMHIKGLPVRKVLVDEAAAMRIILSDPNVKAVLFNIFGGITRGDEVARGILAAMEDVKPNVPMVIRLVGTNAEEGRKLLENANMITAETLADAAKKAVAAAKGN